MRSILYSENKKFLYLNIFKPVDFIVINQLMHLLSFSIMVDDKSTDEDVQRPEGVVNRTPREEESGFAATSVSD